MTRNPRNKLDHLVSLKLITHAYLLQGWIATAAGFFAYFVTMNALGFTPNIIMTIGNTSTADFPSTYAEFNPSASDLGNDKLQPDY